MTTHDILINGTWQASSGPGEVHAWSHADGHRLEPTYPVSPWEELSEMLDAGTHAARALREESPDRIARFLEAYADRIEADRASLAACAAQETGLDEATRLRDFEIGRTALQLRQVATCARERSWCCPTIDGQGRAIRSCLAPLGGPVLVLGPNNFPFAYNGIAGGDFACAIGVGNPIIAKAHPGHPETTRRLALLAREAIEVVGLPLAAVQLFYHCAEDDGLRLAGDRRLGAIGFTGGRRAGMALKRAADEAGVPVFLEMSSVNPVVLLAGALEERAEEIADAFSESCLMGAGQFCTNPGLVILARGEGATRVRERAVATFGAREPGLLLTPGSAGQIRSAIDTLTANGATILVGGREPAGSAFRFENTLLTTAGDAFLRAPASLQTEAFGSVSLLVEVSDLDEMEHVVASLHGNLTGSIYSHSKDIDDEAYRRIEPILRTRVGRLLNDRMPTGVAVCSAMVHGGPWPATGHPGFSAVGVPNAMTRFGALHCYDHVRDGRLPLVLRDGNPCGIERRVDGVLARH